MNVQPEADLQPQSREKIMRAFTLLELLMVLGIFLIVVGAVFPLYGNSQLSGQLNESVTQLVQTVRTARERSVAGFDDASYGVFFQVNPADADQYILYQGASYATRDPAFDRVTALAGALTLQTTLLGDEVHFSGGLGEPNGAGSVTLTHIQGQSQIITINDVGKVDAGG